MSQPRKPPGRVKLFFRKLLHRDSHAVRAHSQQSIVRSPSEPPSPTRGQSADVPASNQENQSTRPVSQDSPTLQASRGADLRPVQASAPATTATGDVPVSEEERAGNLPLSGNMPPAPPHETGSSNAALAHDAPSTPRGNLAGHTAWTVFREALKLTEKVSDVFPPLKAAVSGLNSVLDRIDMVSTARADFADVHDQVNSFAKVIQKYQGLDEGNVPMDIRRRVKGFAQALDLINSSIKDKLDRGTFSSFLSTSYDQTEIVRHVRNIGYLVNEFMMATTANTDTNVEEFLKDAKFNKLKYFAEAAFNGPHSFI